MRHEKFFDLYQNHARELSVFAQTVEDDLRAWLIQEGVAFHSVTHRLKKNESLKAKLEHPNKTYETLWDVTDLVGLRIITYFEDSIESVARVLEKNFAIDPRHSINKWRGQEADRFGYRSLHYVAGAGRLPAAATLPPGFRFEIQVRTVLQHAWAEIEHDLGYKTKEGIPAVIRRKFSRVAGLLEIADEEFVSIRRDVHHYEKKLSQASLGNAEADLDVVLLRALLNRPDIHALDEKVAKHLGRPIAHEPFYPDYVLKALLAADLKTATRLELTIKNLQVEFERFFVPYFKFTKEEWSLAPEAMATVGRGYGLLLLAHVAVLRADVLVMDRVARVAKFYQELDYPDDPKTAVETANRLIEFTSAL